MGQFMKTAEQLCFWFVTGIGMYAAAEAVQNFVGGWLSYAWAGAVVFMCIRGLREAPANIDSEDRKGGE